MIVVTLLIGRARIDHGAILSGFWCEAGCMKVCRNADDLDRPDNPIIPGAELSRGIVFVKGPSDSVLGDARGRVQRGREKDQRNEK